MNEYHVKSELLKAAIWGGTGCYEMSGYTNNDKGNFGRAIIEYFATRLFAIHRLPGFQPHYPGGSEASFRLKYGELSEKEFEEAYIEFGELYKFTQNELMQSGLVLDGKVRLNRSLRSFETKEILPQILLGKTIIEYPSNIITSYAHDGILYCYGSWMSIVRDVPVELIVMYNECLYHPPETCAYQMHGGESEVWVVEKNIFGYTEAPADCFKYEGIPARDKCNAETDKSKYRNHNKVAEEYEKGSLMNSQEALVERPCMRNPIVKWIVEKQNKKNIEYLSDIYKSISNSQRR